MKKILAVGTAALGIGLLLSSIPAGAVPIDPINTRPVTINLGPENPMQNLLDYTFGSGAVNAQTNQQSTGMWSASANPAVIVPVLSFEYAGYNASNIFGIWSDADMDTSTPQVLVDIFNGSATGTGSGTKTSATLEWLDSDTVEIYTSSTNAPKVNVGTFDGITQSSFGFYLKVVQTNSIYFTVDQLNGGTAQSVAFRNPGSTDWLIGFEDLKVGPGFGSDRDYNDLVVKVESIKPVPEPGTMLLLGSGLLGLGLMRRKKATK